MPLFETVSMDAAQKRTAPLKQRPFVEEYSAYIEQLKPRTAGKLQPSDGESTRAVRRRLGSAAKASGTELVIKTVGDEVYFWIKKKRRGRSRKIAGAGR